MAYHFRKLKKTLRLLPSTKTVGFGFSTRLNEGDCNHHNTSNYPDGSSIASLPGVNHLIYNSLKHTISTNVDDINNKPGSGITRSQKDLDLTSQYLPTIISLPSGVLPLPVTYNDLAHILRLPLTVSSDNNLSNSVGAVLRFVNPSNDDMPVDVANRLSDFTLSNHALKDIVRNSFSYSNDTSENTPVDLSRDVCAPKKSHSPHSPEGISSSYGSRSAANYVVQNFSATSDLDHYLSGCDLFSSSTLYRAESASPSNNNKPSEGKSSGKDVPSPEQMHKIKEKLEKVVCKMFSGRQDYSILHKDIVLENNLFGDNRTTLGTLAYSIEILKLRLRVHARFSNTSVELQSVTMLEQSGVIRVHWRLKGLSQIQTLKFWRLFQSKNPISKDDYEWLEAFSYFHIGKDGLVHKHRIDRMIPDDSSGTEKITNTLRELLTRAKPLVS